MANFSAISYTFPQVQALHLAEPQQEAGPFILWRQCDSTAVPALGYQFVNWTQGGTTVSTNSSYSFTVTGKQTLDRQFQPEFIHCKHFLQPGFGGTSSGGGSYSYGDEANGYSSGGSGYNFVNWTLGGSVVSSNASYSFTVTSAATLVANFSQIIYTVSLSSMHAAGGTTSGGGTYRSGTTATVTATPATDTGLLTGHRQDPQFQRTRVIRSLFQQTGTLVANFAVADYTNHNKCQPGWSRYCYRRGSLITWSISHSEGSTGIRLSVHNWTEGGSAVSASANYTFTATGNRNLLANFSQIPRILTLTGPSGTALRNNDVINAGKS